jgi:hypothetical protein
MKPLTIVKSEIFSQAGDGLGRVLVIGKLSATVHDCSRKSCTVAESLRFLIQPHLFSPYKFYSQR